MKLLLLGLAIGFLVYAFREPLRAKHAGSVNIEVHEGRVILTGPAAAPEMRKVMDALRAVPGVRRLDCRLTAHA